MRQSGNAWEGRKEVEEEDSLFLEFCCGFKFEVLIGGSEGIHQICQLCYKHPGMQYVVIASDIITAWWHCCTL